MSRAEEVRRALCHLNSGEATTILASWGSKGYSAMIVPTCRRGAAAREDIQPRLGMSLGHPDFMDSQNQYIGAWEA